MTSDLSTQSQETNPILAHDLHKVLLKIFLAKGSQLSGALTSQEINKLLREYAYRGGDIKYEKRPSNH
ncbi:hypothetical protein O3G_MSEX009045 [Manduca sexta]|nr:hypothetical protein O3G_MSEX009045 [Manduca sexta]